MHHCPASDQPSPLQSLGFYDDDRRNGEKYELKICPACQNIYTFPEMTDVASLYADREESANFHPTHKTEGSLIGLIRSLALKLEAYGIRRILPTIQGSVLDYGCGDGQRTLALAEAMHATSRTSGADFHPVPPPAIHQAGMPYVSYDELKTQASNKYELLILRHCLEHVVDPVLFLQELKGYLTSDGYIFIEVPNGLTIWNKVFGNASAMWFLPYHRVHFSRKGLRATAEKSGFSVINEAGADQPIMGSSIKFALRLEYNRWLFLLGVLLHPLQLLGSFISHEPACLRLVIQRK